MLEARYEDGEILVIDKPAGLATQLGAGVRISLVEAVERDFGFRPHLVHRLDKETAGLIVVARDAGAAAKWTRLLGTRALKKRYRAVVAGRPEAASGRLAEPLRIRGEEKSAETLYRLIGSFDDGQSGFYSYLELELGTGRTHQIRLHLHEAGMPILGDDAHGDFRLNKALKRDYGLKRLLLLSYSLDLPGGKRVLAEPPDYLRAFLAAFPGAPAAEASTPWSATPGAPSPGAGP